MRGINAHRSGDIACEQAIKVVHSKSSVRMTDIKGQSSMSADASTMVILSAVGGTVVTAGGAVMAYVRTLHTRTVKELRSQNNKLERRTAECEEDRKALHGRLNHQSERITDISINLASVKAILETHGKQIAHDNDQNPGTHGAKLPDDLKE